MRIRFTAALIQFGPRPSLRGTRRWWLGSSAGQDIHVYWGKLLRINVHVPDDDVPYLVPKDNPF